MTDQEVIEIRASIMWWFSTLLSKELNEKQFQSYLDKQGAFVLNQLACEPTLALPVEHIKQSLKRLAESKYPYLESAVEFTQVFLTSDKSAVAPYASVHLSKDGLMFQQAHEDMVTLLKSKGLAISREFNEPADHIAIQLDYLGNLILASVKASDKFDASKQQLHFIENKMLTWLPILQNKVKAIENSGFYQNILILLIELLTLEASYLREEMDISQ